MVEMQVAGFSNKFVSSLYQKSFSEVTDFRSSKGDAARELSRSSVHSVIQTSRNSKNEDAAIIELSPAAREYVSRFGSGID
jgi:hypothetical protein